MRNNNTSIVGGDKRELRVGTESVGGASKSPAERRFVSTKARDKMAVIGGKLTVRKNDGPVQ